MVKTGLKRNLDIFMDQLESRITGKQNRVIQKEPNDKNEAEEQFSSQNQAKHKTIVELTLFDTN